MKATAISMFFLIMCLSISALQQSEIYPTSLLENSSRIADSISNSISPFIRENTTAVEASTDIYGFLTYWSYLKKFWNGVKTFFSLSLNFGGYLRSQFNIPSYITNLVNIIIYVIYIAGLFEIFANKKIL